MNINSYIQLSKSNIAMLCLGFVNLLFAYKYGLRATEYIIIPIIMYSAVYLSLPKLVDKFKIQNSNRINLALLLCFVIVFILAFHYISPQSLKVDRWQIITGFWDSVFAGKYPYYPRIEGTNPPGPMPLYFIIALPFYLIGEIGYYSLSGVLLFVYFINKRIDDKKIVLLLILLLLSSLSIYWEIAARSTILINSVLFLIWADYLFKQHLRDNKVLIISSIVSGLLLSTRSIFILLFVVYLIYQLKNKEITFIRATVWSILMMMFYMLPLAFFAILYPNDFWQMNPLIVQSEFLIPSYFIMFFVAIAIVLGIKTKTINELYYYSGMSLFAAIVIYFTYHICQSGFIDGYINSKADISYFIFSIPFLLYYIGFTKMELKS